MAAKIKGLCQVNGYWRFNPSVKGLPKGAPRPKPVYLNTMDREEAMEIILGRRGLRSEGTNGLKEWATVYHDEKKRTGKHRTLTSSGVKAALDVLVGWTGNRDATTVTREMARDFYDSLDKPGRSPATTHRYIRYARAFFSWLIDRRIVKENPFARMSLATPKQSKRDRFCTAKERDALIEACQREDLRGVLIMGFFLGLRINEIVNARWGWITTTDAGGFCTVRNSAEFNTKTGKERQIPIHGRVLKWLNSPGVRPKLRENGVDPGDTYILNPEKPREKAWLRWDPSRPFRQLVKDCGMPWVTFHTMRHTFGSLHAIAGTAEIKIRRWMGITQETWERHYAGLCPDDRDIDRI